MTPRLLAWREMSGPRSISPPDGYGPENSRTERRPARWAFDVAVGVFHLGGEIGGPVRRQVSRIGRQILRVDVVAGRKVELLAGDAGVGHVIGRALGALIADEKVLVVVDIVVEFTEILDVGDRLGAPVVQRVVVVAAAAGRCAEGALQGRDIGLGDAGDLIGAGHIRGGEGGDAGALVFVVAEEEEQVILPYRPADGDRGVPSWNLVVTGRSAAKGMCSAWPPMVLPENWLES